MNDVAALASRDDAARASALDVARSWLVQAPAGSGKTGLLILRFLALLAIVERPERIVATTFTRKAAAEMQDRVLGALRAAGGPTSTPPSCAHEALIRRLAHAALEQDRRMGWRLLEQPGRLRIVTIDALAAAIARQAPLAAGLGALPGFVDDAQALYRDAARAAIEAAPAHDAHWQTFLRWQDNDAEAATRLIAQMLAARDRWPPQMLDEDADALRTDVERMLAQEARDAVSLVVERLPAALADALPALAAMALEHFRTEGERPAYAPALEATARADVLPEPDARATWCGLADWLLTANGTFVRSANRKQGFPPPGRGPGAVERGQRKAAFQRWLDDAATEPGLAEAWQHLRQLPPARFDDAAWAFVVAAMRVLAESAHALESVFAARGQADFAEATLRALAALGAPDDPSDLLLAIDYRLAHLLIDEFQDTSQAQLTLINRLTEGWEPGDGRTLFVVGDPMQSIYRFRQAEVRLFLDAQKRGLVGNVPVGVAELARNFRSQPAIVAWVNDIFGSVLPRVSDASRGEAAYCPAYAETEEIDLEPTLDLADSREAEAEAIVSRIGEARAAGAQEIAVLVRARSHAQALLPALRRAAIDYSAIDLEGLHDRLATRDLLSLARALAQPSDRFAWLAVLHAPWCGLDLRDLLAVAEASRERTIAEAIALPETALQLAPESRARLERCARAIAPALAARGHASFATRVRGAWLALGGPACADSLLDRDGVDRVFSLLAEHEHGGDLADFGRLAETAERLFAEAGAEHAGRVRVMTLHRAKGLEFDAVMLPGLDLPTGRTGAPVLRWKVRGLDTQPTFVLAPMRARMGASAEHDPVYRWLGRLDTAEEDAELGRLLYVGATRAKRRLHLFGVAAIDTGKHQAAAPPRWKRPKGGSALARLWDALGSRVPPPPDAPRAASSATSTADVSELVRLPVDWRLPPLPARLPVLRPVLSSVEEPVFDWADAIAAAVGTAAHRLLAQVAVEGPTAWNDARVGAQWPRIIAELGSEGVESDQRERAAQRVVAIVTRTLHDPRGRWLFDPAHADAHSEWALAGEDDGRIVHVVLDRSFVADGFRYVVDFKTGAHLGGDTTSFLRREFERYRPQLTRYARIVRALDPRPVRIALYHPLVEGGWQEHAPDLG